MPNQPGDVHRAVFGPVVAATVPLRRKQAYDQLLGRRLAGASGDTDEYGVPQEMPPYARCWHDEALYSPLDTAPAGLFQSLQQWSHGQGSFVVQRDQAV
jgi:hypothetical protein